MEERWNGMKLDERPMNSHLLRSQRFPLGIAQEQHNARILLDLALSYVRIDLVKRWFPVIKQKKFVRKYISNKLSGFTCKTISAI